MRSLELLLFAVGVVVIAAVAVWAFAALALPRPSGPASVGTTVLEWVDESRAEEATRATDDRRRIVAQIWYPAAPGSDRPAP